MYRIRFHGRGGQGMKTASRILGSALFLQGFETQDAPRYGAERRGAPIFAYVRASREAINARGNITRPDLIVVADDSLVAVPAAGVLAGADEHAVLLINSIDTPEEWRRRINFPGRILAFPAVAEVEDRAALKYVGAICAGAAARLLGVVTRDSLAQAIRDELSGHGEAVLRDNLERALGAFDQMSEAEGCVSEGGMMDAREYADPDWVELPFEGADISAPSVHGAATSVEVRTGLWRTMRPVIDYARCNRCWWVCSGFCPDGAIAVEEGGKPVIDYEHCKGCLVCVAQCPPHAIEAFAEADYKDAPTTPDARVAT